MDLLLLDLERRGLLVSPSLDEVFCCCCCCLLDDAGADGATAAEQGAADGFFGCSMSAARSRCPCAALRCFCTRSSAALFARGGGGRELSSSIDNASLMVRTAFFCAGVADATLVPPKLYAAIGSGATSSTELVDTALRCRLTASSLSPAASLPPTATLCTGRPPPAERVAMIRSLCPALPLTYLSSLASSCCNAV